MVAEKEDSEDERLAIDCPVLVTERLVLRPPHQDDVPELAVLANNRHVAEMLARMPHPYGEAGGPRLRAIDPQRPPFGLRLCADARRYRRLHRLRRARRDATVAWSSATGSASRTGSTAMRPKPRTRWLTWRSRATAIDVLHASCRVINPASRRVIHKCGFQYAGQGMMHSLVAGQVPIERYRLDRKTWVSLRSWGP